ncbi:MAG: hypothetical protein R3D03_04765 [Geminicoccaceae bacterium]
MAEELLEEGDAELLAGFHAAGAGYRVPDAGIDQVPPEILRLATWQRCRFPSRWCAGGFRVCRDREEFRFAGMQACEQAIEGGETGLALEDAVEAGTSRVMTLRGLFVSLEIGVEPPDELAEEIDGNALAFIEADELVIRRSA